jgi:uncharacterized RDD family membrane protein YckC
MQSLRKYDTFWKRYLASFIDSLIFLPLPLVIHQYERSTNTTAFLLFTLLHVLLFTTYLVIGHGRYGQTLGKYLMGVKVMDVNEKDVIGYRRAFLRECVWFFAQLAGIIYLTVDTTKSVEPIAIHETYYKSIVGLITSTWFLLEVVTMLFNKKRRALHDFIAGSVVVHLIELRKETLQKRQQELIQSLHAS